MNRMNMAFGGKIFAVASIVLASMVGPVAAASESAAPADLDQVLRDLEAYVQAVWDPASVPGMAYAVVKGDQVVYARGFGYRDKDASSGLVDEHTLFEIGSCTKAFNAAAVGTLVDEGSVRWTDTVRHHLPDFKMGDTWATKEFMVEDLMAQRSGMPQYALDRMSEIGFGRDDIRRSVHLVSRETSFRSTFAYQNCMHLWAAGLVEKYAGVTWEEAVRRRILEPLGMSETTFDYGEYYANPNHAMGHTTLEDKSLWTIPSDWPYRDWVTVYAPAGGIKSNVTDMAKWVALQLGNGTLGGRVILKPGTVRTIHTPRICYGEDPAYGGFSSYAMGWVLQSSASTSFFWHTGATTGMRSIVAIFPESGLGLVVLTNSRGHKLPECIVNKLLELYFGAPPKACPPVGTLEDDGPMTGRRNSRPRQTGAGAAEIPLGKLVGTYVNPAYGKAVVKKEGSGVSMEFGPAKIHAILFPMGNNSYGFEWPGWPEEGFAVTFKANATGEVTKLNVEGCEDVRGGDFKRTGN